MTGQAPSGHSWREAIVSAFRRQALIIWVVAVPTLVVAIFYGAIASDVYTSESRFVLRSPARQSSASGLNSLLQSSGFSGFSRSATDDVFALNDFMASRDALTKLNADLRLKDLYSAPEIDRFSRFAGIFPDDSFEALFRFHSKKIDIHLDTLSSISTLTVQGFSARSAADVNEHLLNAAEAFVNAVNERARADLLRHAQGAVAAAEKKSRDAALALAAYRSTKSVVDPERQSAMQLQQVSKLQDEMITARGVLSQLMVTAPDAPQVTPLRARIKALQTDIDAAGDRITGKDSLLAKSPDFQRLVLEQEMSARQLASALSSLEQARGEIQRKMLYLERIVQPNVPDTAEYPRRFRNVFTVFAFCLILAGCLHVVLAGVREHRP